MNDHSDVVYTIVYGSIRWGRVPGAVATRVFRQHKCNAAQLMAARTHSRGITANMPSPSPQPPPASKTPMPALRLWPRLMPTRTAPGPVSRAPGPAPPRPPGSPRASRPQVLHPGIRPLLLPLPLPCHSMRPRFLPLPPPLPGTSPVAGPPSSIPARLAPRLGARLGLNGKARTTLRLGSGATHRPASPTKPLPPRQLPPSHA